MQMISGEHMGTFNDIKLISITLLFIIIGCSDGGKKGAPFSEIADMSVECDVTDGGPASCNSTQNGKPVKLVWSSDPCASGSITNIAAYEDTTLNCVGNTCRAHDSVKWRSPTTGQVIYDISSSYSTAIAWLNLVDNGASDNTGPQSGDVFCCLENQTTYGDMYSSHCSDVP